tara:strand:- start:6049 stop:7059 length:1011 start_codon:yes stop_codon:yes gene_type:complete
LNYKKIKISFVTDNFKNNNCFDENFKSNRDDYLYHIICLKKIFQKANIDFSTHDINHPYDSDAIIQYGTNCGILKNIKNKRYYLLALESPIIDNCSVELKNHKFFKKIFTWNDDLIDNLKYIKINDSHRFPTSIKKKFYNKKLCCLIAGNKASKFFSKNELYTKRLDLIKWFEKNYLSFFDLYGIDWDKYKFGFSFFGRIFNKIFDDKHNTFVSYKGNVMSKRNTLSKYKFSICFENCFGFNGYITEKIFDIFFAGCVPIYLGAKNIKTHIPSNCFIDYTNFKSLDELFYFLNNMKENEYLTYLNNIEKFINCQDSNQFRAEVFAETIFNEIKQDI